MLINYIKEISNKQPTNFHNYATEAYKGILHTEINWCSSIIMKLRVRTVLLLLVEKFF